MSAACSVPCDLDALRERFARAGQDHVFRFWDELDAAGRARLAAQASALDLPAVERAGRAIGAPATAPGELAPPVVERLPEHGGDPGLRARARSRGEALLAEGRVAALVVAGGQGTRLGFAGPKGAFPIGPVTQRSLFELYAQKLRGARRRYGAAIPWVVMTSEATDAAVRACFDREGYFGLPRADVCFFCQAGAPALGLDGRLLLEGRDRLALCPDGHGGVVAALERCGVLDALAERGVERIAYFQVDNPLVRVVDPLLVGLHDLAEAEMTCKVVAKRDPRERAGSVALQDGQLRVVEYTEIAPHHRDLRGPDGALVYWAAAIGMHVIDVAFLRRVAPRVSELLPFHLARKRIPALDASGAPSLPREPNGYKLERFVFDVLAATLRGRAVEIRREEEYSPLKNASGGESPDTARRDLVACYRRWLEAAGRAPSPASGAIEIDHTWIDGPEDAQRLDRDPLARPEEVIRMATGGSP